MNKPTQVLIQIQDNFGTWHNFQTVPNSPATISLTLRIALKQQLAAKSRKVRAIDKSSGALLDMLQG